MNCDNSIPLMLILPAGMMGSGGLADPSAALVFALAVSAADSVGLLGLLEQLAANTATITTVFAVMKCGMSIMYWQLTPQISDPAQLILDCQPERHRRVRCI